MCEIQNYTFAEEAQNHRNKFIFIYSFDNEINFQKSQSTNTSLIITQFLTDFYPGHNNSYQTGHSIILKLNFFKIFTVLLYCINNSKVSVWFYIRFR